MKKVLSFVLVLAMILGCTSMAFAAYKDQADVTNTEAVAVLSMVGVFAGDNNGNMNPKQILKRDEACAVIARLMLGTAKANKLTATVAPFKDVPADNWAAGYIAHCVSEKIVGGIGNGEFNPTGALKVGEFGKMLLCALGYDATVEGLVGEDWANNTDKLMVKAGIEVDEANNEDCAREVAAQLALNALEADCVKYDNAGASISVGGTVIEFGKGSADPEGFTLMQKLYGAALEKDENSQDDFGNPATKWSYKGAEVYAADKAVAQFTKEVNAKDVLSALKGYKVCETEIKTVNTKFAEGSTLAAVLAGTPSEESFEATDSITAELAGYTADGRLVKVFADSNKNITKITTVNYTVAKVSDVKVKKDYTEYSLKNVHDSAVVNSQVYNDGADGTTNVEFAGEVAKNDYVTYVCADETYYVYPTTKVTGTQTSKKGTTITVDGEQYTIAAEEAVVGATTTDYANATKDRDFYLDQFGFVVKADDVKTETVYAVLDKIVGKTETGLNGSQSVEARLVFEDGSTKDVVVSEFDGRDTTKDTLVTIGETLNLSASPVAIKDEASSVGKIVTYTVDKNGNYALKQAEVSSSAIANNATDALTTKGVPTIGTSGDVVRADADTIYIVKTLDAKGKDVFTAYTGYKNVPTIKKAGQSFTAQSINKSGKIIFVYIDATAGYEAAAKDANIFFAKDIEVEEYGTGSDKYYQVAGILNGKEEDVKFKTTALGAQFTADEGKLLNLTIDEDGYVTAVDDAEFAEIDITDSNVTEIARGNVSGFIWNEDTKVYLIDEDGDVSEGEVEDAYNGSVLYYEVVDADGTAVEQATFKTVYIIDDAALAAVG